MEKNQLDLPIGIIDSGVGGLTALAQMNKYLPNESIIYFGDSLRMPYGNRPKEEIVRFADAMIGYLEHIGVKAILIACNTISTYISEIKASVPCCSIIEAGAQSIAEQVKSGSVGIIATCATVAGGMYEREIARRAPLMRVYSSSSASLPKIVDSQLDNSEMLAASIRSCIDPIVQSCPNVRDLLLGCTHFPIIASEIAALYPSLHLIDPAEQQVKNLREYLSKQKLLANRQTERTITLYTTAETYEYAAAIKRLRLEIDTLMKVRLNV